MIIPTNLTRFSLKRGVSILGMALAMALSGAPPLSAETPPAQQPTQQPEPASAQESVTLSAEDQKLVELFEKVGKLFMARQFSEAGALLDEIEKIKPDSNEVRMIRAGIYAETGQMNKAREIYAKEVEANPDAFVPNFNLIELLLMQKKYAEAREGFEKLLEKFPENDFLQFKILLTCLAENKMTDAAIWAQRLQRQVQTPIMLYAAAAISIRSGDLIVGKKLIQLAENQYGAGNQFLLYQSLAGINLVLQSDYPPKPEAAK